MRWTEIREQYPNQWLIVDALEAHTEGDHRKLDQMTVVEVCPDGAAAYQRYRELHQQHPRREFYFVHTAREELDIRERHWLGLMLSTDIVGQIGVVPESQDALHVVRGIGGTEVVFSRRVDRLQVGARAVEQFEIEVGGIDTAFDINGILGMDFLLQTGAIINLGTLQLDFPP